MDEANEQGLRWQSDLGARSRDDRRSSSTPSILLGELLVVLAWLSASYFTVRILDENNRTLSGASAAVIFVVATGVMVVAILAFGRLSSRRIRQGLRVTDLALRSMEIVTDPALSFLPLTELLDELLRRTREVVGGDVATIFLLSADRRFLSVRASRGLEQWMVIGAEVPVGEGVIGSVASRAQAVIVDDVDRVAAAMPLLRDRVASIMAAPLLVEDRVIGVVQVGTRAPHRFFERDLSLLQLVADRAAASIERARLDESERRSRLGAEQARRHLDLLTRAGDVLATALESYEDTFVRLVEVVVPSFADWFAVDLVDDDGKVVRVAYGARGELPHGREEVGQQETMVGRPRRHPDEDRLVQQALASGRPEVVLNAERITRPHGGTLAGAGEFTDAAPAAGVESMIVVPVHVRGLAFGALCLATGAGRRGYRRSDLDTAQGLAERVAIAVERVLLWRETRNAEHAATRNAAQLRLLVEAALGVNVPLEEPEVLRVLVDHARSVLDADCAVIAEARSGRTKVAIVSVSGAPPPPGAGTELVESSLGQVVEAGHVLRSEGPPGQTAWLGVPMPGAKALDRPVRRALLLYRSDGVFSSEGESILLLLAQMASVALENARLYQAVQGNEVRLRAVVESSPLAIAELDTAGRARWWNAAAAQLFGWPPSGTAGATTQLVPVRPSNEEAVVALWADTLAGGANVGVEVGAERPDGRSVNLSVSTAPLRDHAGVVRGILAVMEDVTERRRMLEQVQQTERLSAMARLAGGVAHDFNNLLTVILGSSEILLRQVEQRDQIEEVNAIKRAGERAAGLTSQLLAIGQRPPVQPVVVDPDALIALLEPMLIRVMGASIAVDLVPAAVPQRICIDPAELERALLNLAINAKDAMPEGGAFTVATAPRARVDGSSAAEHNVAIIVSDEGVGMDSETAAHCFEPFFTTKGRAQGTGLGLAAVHASVSQVGGTVLVDTEPGRGTSFTLLFPAAHGEPEPEPEGGEDSLSEGDETVVVVEDEAELRRLEVQALEWRGYTVYSAADGAQALEMVDSMARRPDLVVTDVVMPEVGGVELVSRLRKRWRRLPVLYVSGHLDEHELGDDPAGGPADLLVKPFTPEQLGRRVRQALDRAATVHARRNGGR